MIVLASRSPRRQELLRAAGVEFRVVAPDWREDRLRRPAGRYADLVRRAALGKALAVARSECGLILGADTIVVCQAEVMGKPADPADARRMLRKLSGRWHSVYTGVALVRGTHRMLGYERTEVALRRLSNAQVDWYVSSGEPMDKAGAYAIQGNGAALIRAIRGCYTSVIGLPLPMVLDMLEEFQSDADRGGGSRGRAG